MVSIRNKKRILAGVKGMRGRRKSCIRLAKDAYKRSMNNQFIGRKLRKRSMRRTWIMRLNAAFRKIGMKYSEGIKIFKDQYRQGNNKIFNRRSLSEIAFHNMDDFRNIVQSMQS